MNDIRVSWGHPTIEVRCCVCGNTALILLSFGKPHRYQLEYTCGFCGAHNILAAMYQPYVEPSA